MENNTTEIVLIGGGYASVWAYRSIINELMIEMMTGQVKIRVICPEDYHYFHGWTAECLGGILRDKNRMSPLREIFKHAEIVKGKASRVDVRTRTVYVDLNDGTQRKLSYHHLLLGMGSTDSHAVDGLAEYAYQLKSHNGYLNTKLRIRFLLNQAAEADAPTASKILRFVIAGSGFTGVEIAANLAETIEVLRKEYATLKNIKPTIYLINSRNEILPELKNGMNRMRVYAEKILCKYGIEILHQKKISRVTSQGAYLNDGSFLESRMVISTIGQHRIPLKGTDAMEKDDSKRIIINSFLQVNNHGEIWGAGDAVHVSHPSTNKPCPSNALWAIKQGEHAGKNICRAILSQSLKPFNFKGLGQCASLGIGKGIGELYGIQFTGWTAWITRWFFFQYFMPFKKIMWQEITDWIHLFFTGRRRDLKIMDDKFRKNYAQQYCQPPGPSQLVYQN